MPDHVHFLVEGTSDASNLIRFVKAFKQSTGYACRTTVRGPLWEKSFTDSGPEAFVGSRAGD